MHSASDHRDRSASGPAEGSRPPRERGRPRWIVWALLGFTIVALLALALVPVYVNSRIEPHRDAVTEVAEPASELASDVQLALAREMAAIRGYLVTGEPRYLDRYEEVKADEDRIFPRLDTLARRLGPSVSRRVDTLRTAVNRWGEWIRRSGLLRRGWASDEYFERISLEQGMYESALQASLELESEIRLAEDDIRRRMEFLERTGTRISRGLVVLALVAMAGVAWVGRRLRGLNEELDQWAREEKALREEADAARAEAMRRAREERALRRAAEDVSAAYTLEEVGRRIADSALGAANADGALVQRFDPETGEIDVMAAAGHRIPGLGADMDAVPEKARQRLLRADAAAGSGWRSADGPVLGFVPSSCEGCPVVVVPLGDPPEPEGALVLIREEGRPPFAEEDLDRARIFGELATLAFRKVHLLETAERRRTELERVTESRSRLIRGFTHDLKNPLGAADAHAALLESGIKGPLTEEQSESLSRIRATIGSAFDLINELVELGRVEAGQMRIDIRPVDVQMAAAEVAEEYRAQADAAGLDLRVKGGAAVPDVPTDPQRVRQILGNLVSNAVKYTRSGSVTIRVRARGNPDAPNAAPDRVDLEVSDTGPGIPEEKLDLLFREFSRLDVTGVPGAGLGLAISRRIAWALGGEITVDTKPGVGSTFVLSLPLASESP